MQHILMHYKWVIPLLVKSVSGCRFETKNLALQTRECELMTSKILHQLMLLVGCCKPAAGLA